jgi:DNA-binding transcriptional MerR regulator
MILQQEGDMARCYRIGEAAARVGLTPKALRFYDRLGLVRPASRSTAGYRLYSEEDINALRLIKTAKHAGLALGQIRSLLPLHNAHDCGEFRAQMAELIEDQLRSLQGQIERLQEIQAALDLKRRQLQTTCRPLRGDACGCTTSPEATLVPVAALRSLP